MLLAIDQGTTDTTCLMFDLQGELIGRAYREITQHFPGRRCWPLLAGLGRAPERSRGWASE